MFITTNVHSANQMEPFHSISGEKKNVRGIFFSFFQQFLSPLGLCFGFSNDYCVNDSENMKLSLVEQNINKLTGIKERHSKNYGSESVFFSGATYWKQM